MDSDNLIIYDNRASALSSESADYVGNLELSRVGFDDAVRKGEAVLEECKSGKLLAQRLIVLFVLRGIAVYLQLDLRILAADAFAGRPQLHELVMVDWPLWIGLELDEGVVEGEFVALRTGPKLRQVSPVLYFVGCLRNSVYPFEYLVVPFLKLHVIVFVVKVVSGSEDEIAGKEDSTAVDEAVFGVWILEAEGHN